jgi:hypothetical protein
MEISQQAISRRAFEQKKGINFGSPSIHFTRCSAFKSHDLDLVDGISWWHGDRYE